MHQSLLSAWCPLMSGSLLCETETSLAFEMVTSLLVNTAMQSSSHACPVENSGDWMVGILWHSDAAGDSWVIGRLPLLVPVMVQLLAVRTDMPFAAGCSLISGVEALARLVVHPASATIASSAMLSAWKGLLAGSALVGLGDDVKWWCVVDIGSSNVTALFFFPQHRQSGIR